jgi:nitronate monooxygenase
MPDVLRTALCDVLGIDYPILQSGMGSIAGAELVAEVSRAGGLGILAGLNVPPAELRERIAEVRARTDRPFGVNLWLHPALRPPVDPETVPAETLAAVQSTLDGFRARLGLPGSAARPARLPDLIEAQIEVLLDERVPVFSVALGDPGADLVARCRARGVKVIAMVTTVADARAVARSGVDAVVAQGAEAGGHRSTWVKGASPEPACIGTMALVPQVVDAVAVPVIAASGIVDGRGVVAALGLGAAGVLLGTRFVATRESLAAGFYKKALLEREAEATTVTDVFSGLWARALRNAYVEEYRAAGAPVLPPLLQAGAAKDVVDESRRRQDGGYVPMWSGQGVGLIRDLPGAGEVVEALVREARAGLAALPRRVRTG